MLNQVHFFCHAFAVTKSDFTGATECSWHSVFVRYCTNPNDAHSAFSRHQRAHRSLVETALLCLSRGFRPVKIPIIGKSNDSSAATHGSVVVVDVVVVDVVVVVVVVRVVVLVHAPHRSGHAIRSSTTASHEFCFRGAHTSASSTIP